jgi:hypothetical protein
MVDEIKANPDFNNESEKLGKMSDRELFSRVIILLVMTSFKQSTSTKALVNELMKRSKND